MKNVDSDKSEEIKLMNALELFVFHNMLHSMSSENRSDSTLIQAKNENEFRFAVYALHDEGKLKETEQQKIARLRAYPYTDEITGYPFPDHPTRKLTKSYDEAVTAIRDLHNLNLATTSLKKIQTVRKNAFTIYARHFDCHYTKELPATISEKIKRTQQSFMTNKTVKYKRNVYLQHLGVFVKEHYPKRIELWDKLYFKKMQIAKFEKFLKTYSPNNESPNQLQEHIQNHKKRLDSLIDYINGKIVEGFIKEIISNYEAIKG